MSNRKFGVEFELNGITESRAYKVLKDAGIAVTSDAYWSDVKNAWEIKEDSSVNDGFEIASPILCGERGIAQAKKVARLLTAAGARVDSSCGFHVHVDARDLSAKTIINVAMRYGKYENEIDSFMPRSRRNSHFAQSVKDLIDKNEIGDIVRSKDFDNFDRYYKVNLAAYGQHGTIEFRQHAGTLNPNKVEKWVRFCVEFVEASVVDEKSIGRKLNRLIDFLANDGWSDTVTKEELSESGFSRKYVREAAEKLKEFGYTLNFYDDCYQFAAPDENWRLVSIDDENVTIPSTKRDSLFRNISPSVRRHLRRRMNSVEREEEMLARNARRTSRRTSMWDPRYSY